MTKKKKQTEAKLKTTQLGIPKIGARDSRAERGEGLAGYGGSAAKAAAMMGWQGRYWTTAQSRDCGGCATRFRGRLAVVVAHGGGRRSGDGTRGGRGYGW